MKYKRAKPDGKQTREPEVGFLEINAIYQTLVRLLKDGNINY